MLELVVPVTAWHVWCITIGGERGHTGFEREKIGFLSPYVFQTITQAGPGVHFLRHRQTEIPSGQVASWPPGQLAGTLGKLFERPTDRETEWPCGRLASWPAGYLASWLAGQLAGWSAGQLAIWPAGQLASQLAIWPAGHLASWLAGQMASWLSGQLASWPAGQIAGRPAGYLASWPAAYLASWTLGFLFFRFLKDLSRVQQPGVIFEKSTN